MSLALLLHAHLPFVRHPEHPEFFEENWLFEAITESYLPLLRMMQRGQVDGVPFRLTMSITPPLCAMLRDELLQSRYLRYLDRNIAFAGRENERHHAQPEVQELARFYFQSLEETRALYQSWQGDLLGKFRQLQDDGALEIIASAATHGLLPLLAQSPQAVRAQIRLGCDSYRENFGREPRGFWLPECAYLPGLEKILAKENIRWFALDAHGLLLGKPRPQRAIYAPCFTSAGPAVFARDPESSRQVWSAQSGYPGDAAYREFYRDAGFDFPEEAPRFTGIKYHRITGRTEEKEIYRRDWAEEAAEAHAEHFFQARRAQLRELRETMSDPIVFMPFDAELFGHWWYEGPSFLEKFIRKCAAAREEFSLVTPSEFLERNSTQEVIAPAASSWGEGGFWGVWLHESNAWIYPHLQAAARRLTDAVRVQKDEPDGLTNRCLQQLARELLLAQSSDWGFLLKTGTAPHYAARRVHDHILRFNRLHESLRAQKIDEPFLAECESRDNLFPEIEWRYFL